MTPSTSKIVTPSAQPRPVTLEDVMRELQAQREMLNIVLKTQNVFSDQVDELITKVDEINLPVGSGMGIEYES